MHLPFGQETIFESLIRQVQNHERRDRKLRKRLAQVFLGGDNLSCAGEVLSGSSMMQSIAQYSTRLSLNRNYTPAEGTGKTTGLILECISEAILSPNEWVEFVDHRDNESSAAHLHCFDGFIKGMKLLGMKTEVRDEKVFVMFDLNSLRHTDQSDSGA